VAADDAADKQKVMHLVEELGFDPVEDASLHESWRQQPGTPSCGADLTADKLRAFRHVGLPSHGGATR
jgi:predicted dinucleotide-binding enzyme